MNIKISVMKFKELLLHVFASDAASRLDTRKVLCDTLAGRGAGRWVSHPIADMTKEPPSVMTVAADEDAAEVWRIVDGRLSALERWVESETGKPGISVGVTLSGDTVNVRIAVQSDMDCDPLMVRQTKVKKGRDNYACAERILSEAYNVVFGKFEGLSYREFIDSISVAADGR